MCFVCVPAQGSVPYVPEVIRVGLYYGANALPTANLANEVGSGYSYGYFSEGGFVSVGSTWREKITIAKDSLIYLASGSYYDVRPASVQAVIGPYHVELPDSYFSYEEALSASSSLEEAGIAVMAFPSFISGSWRVRVNSYQTLDEANASAINFAPGSYAVGGSATCYTVLATGSEKIIFEFDMGSSANLAIMPVSQFGEKTVTWFKGEEYYGAFEYKRIYGNDVTVINVIDIDDYVEGVIPYEMSASWPLEALKAQAVCARTYAACNLEKHKTSGFDLCNTTDCQVYYGLYRGSGEQTVLAACEQTASQCVYYNGELAETYYCASDGGATEDVKNVWGSDVPYLKAVQDPYEELTVGNKGVWSVTYTGDELGWLLNNKGYSCSGRIVNCYVKSRTAAGNVFEVIMVDSAGKEFSFKRAQACNIFYSSTLDKSANSIRYTINGEDRGGSGNASVITSDSTSVREGTLSVITTGGIVTSVSLADSVVLSSGGKSVIKSDGPIITPEPPSDGKFTLSGTGWGHNVGMSQQGARGMANQGFTYDQIIKFYFTGVDIY